MIATALLATAFLIDTKHRLAALLVGFVVGLAFTIRLDIGLVAGITALTTTLCLLAFQSFKEVIYKGVIALAGFLIAAGPTLLYVQIHSDIVSYFIKGGYHADKSLLADLSVATGMGSQRDLLGIIGPVSLPAERLELTIELAEIDMRYASSIDATERNTLETTYGLTAAYARPDGQTWNYRLLQILPKKTCTTSSKTAASRTRTESTAPGCAFLLHESFTFPLPFSVHA